MSWVATSPTVTTVNYFIHNHGGTDNITANMFQRLRDADAVWDNSGANVNLNEVFSDATADLHVHNDSTSGCGGGGTLGCAEFAWFTAHNPAGYGPATNHPTGAGPTHAQHQMASQMVGAHQELTMISSINWYDGVLPGGIGGTQFDYMTVAIQEFGHHLGLAHPDDPGVGGHADDGTSPMRSTLPPETARRVLVGSDVAAITHLYGVPELSTFLLFVFGIISLAMTSVSRGGRS